MHIYTYRSPPAGMNPEIVLIWKKVGRLAT